MLDPSAGPAIDCPNCGTEIPGHFLTCPGCHRLVHAEQLKALSERARESERAGDLPAAMSTWREALALLPPSTTQAGVIRDRIDALGRTVDRVGVQPAEADEPQGKGWAGPAAAGLGTIGLMLWKFKFLALVLATKGKLLLLGLTKLSTLTSMLTTIALYWTLYGWRFAVGFVAAIYIREMGRFATLLRYGVKADAPMFVPFFGTSTKIRQNLASPREAAQVALAGPLWGFGASIAFMLGSFAMQSPVLAVLAKLSAAINLLSLCPIWIFDGAMAFVALSRQQRWISVAVATGLWIFSADSVDHYAPVFLFLVMVTSVYRAGFTAAPERGDRGSFLLYNALTICLSLFQWVEIPAP